MIRDAKIFIPDGNLCKGCSFLKEDVFNEESLCLIENERLFVTRSKKDLSYIGAVKHPLCALEGREDEDE